MIQIKGRNHHAGNCVEKSEMFSGNPAGRVQNEKRKLNGKTGSVSYWIRSLFLFKRAA